MRVLTLDLNERITLRHCEPFSALNCTGLQDFAYAISNIFRGDIPDPCRASRCLDPDTDFRFARQQKAIDSVLRNDHGCSDFVELSIKPFRHVVGILL